MTLGLPQRLLLVWAGLMLATVVSWATGPDHGAATHGAQAGAVVALALAMIKVRYVALDFMEVRSAPPALRWGMEAWVAVVGTTLVVLYLAA